MIALRKAGARGRTRLDWLESWHSFSFGNYYDPDYESFHALRVLNEDIVAPGGGFPEHGHRDMEIVTYILEGALEHKDSLGTGSVIRPGDVQRMSAGTGIRHSEYNHSKTQPVHLLQIWFLPAELRRKPEYEQTHFSSEKRRNRLLLVGSTDGREGSVRIHQDVAMYAGILDAGISIAHDLSPGRAAWLHVAKGTVALNEHMLQAGDGAAIRMENSLNIHAKKSAEIVVFDLA